MQIDDLPLPSVEHLMQVFLPIERISTELAQARRLAASTADGLNYSHRSPKGNRHLRRLLNQSANAAARTKGSVFEIAYRRSVPRLGHNQAIGAIAHRQCRLIWLILHQGVRYEERGPAVTKRSKQKRTARMDPATPKPRLPDRTTQLLTP